MIYLHKVTKNDDWTTYYDLIYIHCIRRKLIYIRELGEYVYIIDKRTY